MASRGISRRSFLVELLNKSAGLWVIASGGAAAVMPGCSSNTGGTGATPQNNDVGSGDLAPGDQGPVVKYGGPPDVDAAQLPDTADDLGPVVKYGGPPQDVAPTPDAADDIGPVVKYGGPPQPDVESTPDAAEDIGPVVKYGGPPQWDAG